MAEAIGERPRTGLALSPGFGRLLQLAVTLFVAVYMLCLGGTFDGSLRYRVQLLNTIGGALMGLVWLVVRFRQGGRIAVTGLEWPLTFFALSQWLALLTSAQPRLGLEWVASVTMWTAALLIVCDLLRRGWPRAFVVQALLLLAAFVTVSGLAEVARWYAGWLQQGLAPTFVFRLNGWLGHANLTAAFLNALLPLALACAMSAATPLKRTVWALLAAGMLATLLFTSSRAGWLAGAFGLAVFAALVNLRPGRPASQIRLPERWRALSTTARWLVSLGALLGAVLVAALLAAQSQHITHGPLFSSREVFWRVAWEMFQLQPLTGAGPDLYPWFYTRWVASPPQWFAPHAHSLPLQLLAGSGLLGLAAFLGWATATAWQLVRRWLASPDRLLLAGLMAGLASFGLQQVFDNLLGSNAMLFVVVIVLALALSGTSGNYRYHRSRRIARSSGGDLAATQPAEQELQDLVDEPLSEPRSFTQPPAYATWRLAPLVLVPLCVSLFALRGAALNDHGLSLASEGDWPAAAQAFEQAAATDPGLTLYWQHAAYAHTQSGRLEAALPLWQRAAHDDPYWPLLAATAGVLRHSQDEVQQAFAQGGSNSHLTALNLGVIAEIEGDVDAAQVAYRQALDLRPASAAALFWQQTALRRALLDVWTAAHGEDTSPQALGRQALAEGQSQTALEYFQTALAQAPNDVSAYAGLAAAYQALGDATRASAAWQTGMRIPVIAPDQTLSLHLLAGDWARARGDDTAAVDAYGLVFSAIGDYTVFGPGTYGHPQRSWYVYRRAALPADLVPQLARADITAEMDERFAWLAGQLAQNGEMETACFVVERVWREAPESLGGDYWRANCA